MSIFDWAHYVYRRTVLTKVPFFSLKRTIASDSSNDEYQIQLLRRSKAIDSLLELSTTSAGGVEIYLGVGERVVRMDYDDFVEGLAELKREVEHRKAEWLDTRG